MMEQRGLRIVQRAFLYLNIATALWLVTLVPAIAQTTVGTGSINGVVTDPSGAVVGSATVSITNTATNSIIRLTSNSSGAYTSGALTPGEYRVQVSAKGFSSISQVVSVQPSSSYSLTGWVEGDYVFLGDSGTGTSDTDNWTPSATTWTELSTSFTTGSSTTSVTIYIHGWYAQPVFYADSLSLTGPAVTAGEVDSAMAAHTGIQSRRRRRVHSRPASPDPRDHRRDLGDGGEVAQRR